MEDDHGSLLMAALDEAGDGRAGRRHPSGRCGVPGASHRPRHTRRVQRGAPSSRRDGCAGERGRRSGIDQVYRAMSSTRRSPLCHVHGAHCPVRIPAFSPGEPLFVGEEAWLRSRGVTVEVVQDADCMASCASSCRRIPTSGTRTSGVTGDVRPVFGQALWRVYSLSAMTRQL